MTLCQPVAPSGAAARLLGLGLAVAVGGPHVSVCSPGVGVPAPRPLPPGVVETAAQRRPPATAPSSTRTSTCGCPGAAPRPPRRWSPARRSGRARRGVSIRDCGLDRRLRGPAPRHPVRVEVGEAWSARSRSATCWPRRSRRGRARPGGPGSRARRAAARRSCRRPAARRARRAATRSGSRRSSRRPSGRRPGRRRRCGAASSSRSRSGTPSQRALPTRSPPTSLETQASVTSRSTIGRASRSS